MKSNAGKKLIQNIMKFDIVLKEGEKKLKERET